MEEPPVTTSWVKRSAAPPGYRALMFLPPFLLVALSSALLVLTHAGSAGLAVISLAFYPVVLLPWFFVVMEIQDRRRLAISIRSDAQGIEIRMPSRSPQTRLAWGDVRAISKLDEPALWRLSYADRLAPSGEQFILITPGQGEALGLTPSGPSPLRVG